MDNQADHPYPIHPLLTSRWSPLAFAERTVSDEDLQSLFEAARWAPSCYNDQPWHFVVVTRDQPEASNRLVSCLAAPNIVWAQHAPVLMLTVVRRNFAHNGRPNGYGRHDLGLAVGAMLVQATALGLSVHQMAGFDADQARAAFAIPDDCEPVSVIALGYHGNPADLPEALQAREAAARNRKPLDTFVFAGTWNGAAPFIR